MSEEGQETGREARQTAEEADQFVKRLPVKLTEEHKPKAVAEAEKIFAEAKNDSPEKAPNYIVNEKLAVVYQQLEEVLPKIGIQPTEVRHAYDSTNYFHLVGKSGNFELRKSWDKGYFEIAWRNPGGKSDKSSETYTFYRTGEIKYRKNDRHGNKKEEGEITKDREKNGRQVEQKALEFAADIVQIIDNPEYSVENLKNKLVYIKGIIEGYLREKGVVPKTKTVSYKHEANAIDRLMSLAGMPEDKRSDTVEIPQTYESQGVPGISSLVDVRFDTDILGLGGEMDSKSVRSIIGRKPTEAELAHGQGLIMSYTNYSYAGSSYNPVTYNYRLWENGDAQVPGGSIESFSSVDGKPDPRMYDPHYVYQEFQKIADAIEKSRQPRLSFWHKVFRR